MSSGPTPRKRKHLRKELDSWEQIAPHTGEAYEGFDRHFIVFRDDNPDNRHHYFVAQELFEGVLGLRNYYTKLSWVPDDEKVYKRVKRGSVPKVCVSERGIQQMLDKTRFSPKKLQLTRYLNSNYVVDFESKRRKEKVNNPPPCDGCVVYEGRIKTFERICIDWETGYDTLQNKLEQTHKREEFSEDHTRKLTELLGNARVELYKRDLEGYDSKKIDEQYKVIEVQLDELRKAANELRALECNQPDYSDPNRNLVNELNVYKNRCKILEEMLLLRSADEQDGRSESDDDEQNESIHSGPSTPDE